MHKEKILVDKLIKKYNTSNPFEVCDQKNIHVLYQPLGSLNGFYRYSKRSKFITLNSDRSREQQIATCCDELGHCLMHPNENSIFLNSTLLVPTKREIEADRFAAYMLLEYYQSHEYIEDRLLRLIASSILIKYITESS